MKKAISVVLALALCLVGLMIPAFADENVTGTWYLKEVHQGEVVVNASTAGISMSITLNEDGSAELISQQNDKGTWTKDGDTITLTRGEDKMTLKVVNDTLQADMNGTMIFTREQPAAVAKPEAVAAESDAAFQGNWVMAEVEVEGHFLPVTAVVNNGQQVISGKLSIADGKAAIDLTILGIEVPTIQGPVTFENGALNLKLEGLDTPITFQMTNTNEVYTLISVASLNMDMPMYFTKAN